ncbi:MAG: tripartite tricarboxylate transporter TctB family protein [Spirochaetales bacterium]|nr:tripartite tricarboxylate transporter TctB family protein [Spirochaetales bacterium]
MANFSKWLTNLSYWWILLGFVAIMTGLFFLFGIREKTRRVRIQLLCLCGMDLVTLLFYLLTFNLRVSKLAADSGASPRTMPRLWALLMALASVGAFFAIIRSDNKEDEKFNRWVFALLVGVGSIFSVIMFQYIGYYISSAIFIFVVMIAMGERNKLQLALVPAIWCLFTYYVFFRLLYIKLPFGSLFNWLPNHSLITDLVLLGIILLAVAGIVIFLILRKKKSRKAVEEESQTDTETEGGLNG